MDRIDRYILRHLAGPFFGALLGALALMMLERMLRLIDLVGESEDAIGYVFDMLANLIPHYLGLALPAALFIACFVGYRRLAQNSELAAFSALGRGLFRMSIPAFLLAGALAAVSLYVHSHLQPHGRYAFRTLGFLAANASIAAALKSGAFVEFDEVTFMAEKGPEGGRALKRAFVHERPEEGGTRTVTSVGGELLESSADRRAQINFSDGLIVEDDVEGKRTVVSFERLEWPINRGVFEEFRPRGANERELTMPELWTARASPPEQTTSERVEAEFHGRAARALTVLLMPLLAIPLAAAGGRVRSAAPFAVGVAAFLLYVQSIQFAEGMADLGHAPAAAAIWTPFAIFSAGCALLFLRAWRGVGFDFAFTNFRRPVRPKRRKQAETAS